MEYAVVDRPNSIDVEDVLNKIIAVSKDNRAIEITKPEYIKTTPTQWAMNRFKMKLKARGYKLHTKSAGSGKVIVWVEKKK